MHNARYSNTGYHVFPSETELAAAAAGLLLQPDANTRRFIARCAGFAATHKRELLLTGAILAIGGVAGGIIWSQASRS